MKPLTKRYFRKLPIILIFTIISLLAWGVIHEMTHFSACNLIGLKSQIHINIFQDPPKYQALCEGINETSPFEKFIFWGSPYLISFILLLCFLLFWKWKSFYTLSIPFGIVMSDIFNLAGFYQWFFGAGQIENDLFQLAFKARFYLIFLFILIGLSITAFILIYIKTIEAEAKKGEIKLKKR